jgi:hypothetical protein
MPIGPSIFKNDFERLNNSSDRRDWITWCPGVGPIFENCFQNFYPPDNNMHQTAVVFVRCSTGLNQKDYFFCRRPLPWSALQRFASADSAIDVDTFFNFGNVIYSLPVSVKLVLRFSYFGANVGLLKTFGLDVLVHRKGFTESNVQWPHPLAFPIPTLPTLLTHIF